MLKQPYNAIIHSPVGLIGICTDKNHLTRIDFLLNTQKPMTPSDPIAKSTTEQLSHYFDNPNFSFDIPLKFNVSPFQEKVLNALQDIPCGQTEYYGSLAKKLQTSPRPIGMACRRNPISIIIPCHRVTAKNSLGGFGGETEGDRPAIKSWLLEHEKIKSR